MFYKQAFKAINGLTQYNSDMFRVSRSGMNLVSNSRVNRGSSKVKKLQKSFLPERVMVTDMSMVQIPLASYFEFSHNVHLGPKTFPENFVQNIRGLPLTTSTYNIY